MTPQRATLTGLLAIVLWSTSVGLIRSLTEALGPIGGAAMIYSTSTLCLLAFYGLPRIKTLPRIYLFAGGAMFVCYEIFLSLSIGLADSRMQAIEIGMINYLWPSLTILFSLFINQQKSRFMLWPGLALALGGIVWIMKGESDWTQELLWNNVLANPLAYSLAFSAALTWALYCNITKRYGQGKSGVSLFFFHHRPRTLDAVFLQCRKCDFINLAKFAATALYGRINRISLFRLEYRYSAWQSDATRNRLLFHARAFHSIGRVLAQYHTRHFILARRRHGHGRLAALLVRDAYADKLILNRPHGFRLDFLTNKNPNLRVVIFFLLTCYSRPHISLPKK